MSVGSVLLTTAVIGNAYFQKKQFYPSVVYITKSNPSMAVIYLQAFVLVLLMGKLMRRVFFGQLRAAEMEHLIERSWYAVTETCLAFTVFRDDFSPKFVALFTLLLFLKCFHWLAEDRVDYMERSPVISWLFHIRVTSLLLLLASLDFAFVIHAYVSTMMKGPTVQLVFGFEYAILFSVVASISVKYVLHTIDLHRENPWERKAVFLLYSELALGLIKVILYMSFMAIMIKIHTFPLFAIRPMYLSMRAFKKAVNDVIMSRRAIQNMNTLYPDATVEELATVDNVCIICREEMTGGGSSKKLPCNHIFHASCLRSWFQRQQTCPTCRMDVLRSSTPAAAAPGANHAARAGQQPPQQQQQQQQPQQQMPQMPNLGNWAGVLPGAFPAFPFWPPQPQQQVPPQPPPVSPQQQQASPGTSSSGTSPSSSNTQMPSHSTTSSSNNNNNNPATVFMAPFPLPFLIPPPPLLPANDLSSLSMEELQAMEGQERQNVEARIQCLRQIQTLLDAAVMQMQQYSSVVASLRTVPSTNETKETQPTTSASSNGSEISPSTSNGTIKSTVPEKTSNIPSSQCNGQEEVRRRRLQRFEQSEGSGVERLDNNDDHLE